MKKLHFLVAGMLAHGVCSAADSHGTSLDRTKVGFAAEFAPIQAGDFFMGSPENEPGRNSDEALHKVVLTKDFEIQVTEVTQQQYFLVTGVNPYSMHDARECPTDYQEINGIPLCPNNPVAGVSWRMTQEFIEKINSKSVEYVYRLPTEAEWEYTARAGTSESYFFGNDSSLLGNFAWSYPNAADEYNPLGRSHAVAQKGSNPHGIYDIYGNVDEWVSDWYGPYSTFAQIDPMGPTSGSERVLRGGGWTVSPRSMRSANRQYAAEGVRFANVGFRLVRNRR